MILEREACANLRNFAVAGIKGFFLEGVFYALVVKGGYRYFVFEKCRFSPI